MDTFEFSETSARSSFGAALEDGLGRSPKSIPPKFFYDHEGSLLFEQICRLPEYYVTRTEFALLDRLAPAFAEIIGPEAELIEFGAGEARKVRFILDALDRPNTFIPIDISSDYLAGTAADLRRHYPNLNVQPVAGDFTQPLDLGPASGRRVGFFPGSTIGNFEPEAAREFLARAAELLAGGGLLIGVDLVKDPAVLHAAYNDTAGVTARFNLNLLARANRELGLAFDLDAFRHYAFYNPLYRRIEMYLVSTKRQSVALPWRAASFEEGEPILTEHSYKYTIEGFQELSRKAGFSPRQVWVDPERLFSLHWLASS